jgi:hypothetical protein
LKEVHERTHPGAKLGKPDVTKKRRTTPEAEALLAKLVEEADGDHE